MARILESMFLQGPAGRLEALHEGPGEHSRIVRAAVICHPHPLHGGTMHNKVVFRMARAAREAGSAVIRFNFRGVGTSQGEHDEGRGEQDDLRAAIAYARDRYPGLPLVLGGFSFGSRVALRVSCREPGVERVVSVGTPVDHFDWSFLTGCACPKQFIHSTNDQFGTRPTMEKVFASAAEPKGLKWVESADHFFVDALDAFEEAAHQAVSEDFV